MNNKQLIGLLSANPLLYDLKYPRYCDKLKDKIGGELNQPQTNAFLYVVCIFINKIL